MNDVHPIPAAVEPRDYHSVIAKVASVKDVDVAKLRELMEMQEAWETRRAEEHFNELKAKVETELQTISQDMVNPITRSKYASLAAIMEVTKPVYSKYGFSVDFDELSHTDDTGIVLAAYVSNGSIRRKYQKWIPVSTTGIGGRTSMTLTHASVAAVTYGRRALLKMIFNLAETDDDGNQAGGKMAAIPEEFVEAFRTAAFAVAKNGEGAMRDFFMNSSEQGQIYLRQWHAELKALYPAKQSESTSPNE